MTSSKPPWLVMGRVHLEPFSRRQPGYYPGREVALYAVAGSAEVYYGSSLREHARLTPDACVHIPAGAPYLLANPTEQPFVAVVGHAGPYHPAAWRPVEVPGWLWPKVKGMREAS